MTEGVVRAFREHLPFRADGFQDQAMDALAAGRSVLVAAPTGAGKTLVGEFACHLALTTGGKAFYTTPIKALSNQKYRDLTIEHGEQRVGLLTGDRSINGEAPVVVMTTEVLRNMLFTASPTMQGLQTVILDEVHYLGDRERGGTWEEVIVQLPASVQVAALSATVSNAEEFGEWLTEALGNCETIVTEHRPVPLRHHYWVNGTIHDTFRTGQQSPKKRREDARQARDGVPNPDMLMLERQAQESLRVRGRGGRGKRVPRVRMRWPGREEVVTELDRREWLPAILFVFSRAGCDKAVAELRRAGLRLTADREADEIASIVDTLLSDIPAVDLEVLDHEAFRSALQAGIAPHHAGLIPAFKEAVEVCFQRGLLKVVIATETLALGINMPARTVVIERLEKWDGAQHTLLTPGQYTQLTGRAGRRGLDRIGHAIVLHQRDIPFRQVAGLVSSRSHPLLSTFRPSHNLVVNLLATHTVAESEAMLEASFAQFQADRRTGARSRSLVDQFERRVRVLQQLDHLDDGPRPTALGRQLAGIYSEVDLVISEAIRRGIFDGLSAPALAGLVSMFVFEARSDEEPDVWIPTPALREAVDAAEDVLHEVQAIHAEHGVPLLRELDASFVPAAWRWARGASLDQALVDHHELTPGDFVRVVKQVVDVLGQLRDAVGGEIGDRAHRAVEAMRRGIVDL